MKRLLIASVVMVGGLTGCAADRMDGQSGAGRISGFLLLLLVGVVLYLAFSGVEAPRGPQVTPYGTVVRSSLGTRAATRHARSFQPPSS